MRSLGFFRFQFPPSGGFPGAGAKPFRGFTGPWKFWIVAAVVSLVLPACHQDPIFDMISREVKPQAPRIKGVPTRLVIFNRAAASEPVDWGVYVGASSLHRYAQAANGSGAVWDEEDIPQPPGKIFDLAATQTHLYALTGADSSKLYRLGGGSTEWEEVGFASGDQGFPRIQAIYGEINSEGFPISDYLFVGASNTSPQRSGSGNFGIFYTDGVSSGGGLVHLKSNTAVITGAASEGNNHYVSTDKDGVYYAGGGPSPAGFQKIFSEESGQITGLINIGSAVLALDYEGDIFRASGGGFTQLNTNSNRFNFRGAAAVCKTENNDSLLLVAVRNSDPVYGYREILLGSGPLATLSPGEIELRHPGDALPTTVGDNKQFKDTVEPKPVNALLQVPANIDPARGVDDPGKVLLVSIQGTGQGATWFGGESDTDGGLWSYRSRDGIWQWNAEN